jgi:hypothetical protein
MEARIVITPATSVYLVASGDLRPSANRVCWTAQAAMEASLTQTLTRLGAGVTRAHAFDAAAGHGFLDSQRAGMDAFARIPKDAPVIVAEAVWQYSHHVLAGLQAHRGPVLTVANWSGQWPGLVGMLNLNGSLTKVGRPYATLWSEDFEDAFFVEGLRTWLESGDLRHDRSHVRPLDPATLPADAAAIGRGVADALRTRQAILGVFDEGCMGMANAILEDHLLNPLGVFKERLSQSALYAATRAVDPAEARAVYDWLLREGLTFDLGSDEATELTEAQVLQQCAMYVAAVRIAHDFGCDAIGIQYQQGLKDLLPASDLVEGLLNDRHRPPVTDPATGAELYAGDALPHFNEVDEAAGLDALVTHRVWSELGLDPATTLHDLRWGERYAGPDREGRPLDAFVWIFEISGAAPAAHFEGGYRSARSERQPAMYFPLGGGTLKGVSKAGEVVWSRVYVEDGALHLDLGRATAVALPDAETERRWAATTPQWPIMHAVLHGVSRDQMMAKHKANHVQVVYAPDAASADHALAAKAAAFAELGVTVHLCGDVPVG